MDSFSVSFVSFRGFASFFFGCFVFSVSTFPIMRRFFSHLKKAKIYEDSGSPDMPSNAKSASGKAVKQSMMIRAVNEILIEKTGTPTETARIPASITFRILNIPPNRVPPSMKFGGRYMYLLFAVFVHQSSLLVSFALSGSMTIKTPAAKLL